MTNLRTLFYLFVPLILYENLLVISLLQMPAGDPEIEILHYGVSERKPKPEPAAAWVLVTLLLIQMYTVQYQARTANIFGEMCELFLDGTVRGNNNRNKAYSRKMMIFCMTLVGYSTKAYSFLRESAKKCLPSVRTLRRYRKRVDGSPGFSTTAMNMIKQKVTEMHNESKQLFLSVSCDDMSIRYIFLTH